MHFKKKCVHAQHIKAAKLFIILVGKICCYPPCIRTTFATDPNKFVVV